MPEQSEVWHEIPPTPNHPCRGTEPPSLEQEGISEAEAMCTLQGWRQALTPGAFLSHSPFESQHMESWGGNLWGRGGVTAKSPSGMLLPQPPAKAQGAPCQCLVFPLPKERKATLVSPKKNKPWDMPDLSIPSKRDFLPQHHNTAPLTVG